MTRKQAGTFSLRGLMEQVAPSQAQTRLNPTGKPSPVVATHAAPDPAQTAPTWPAIPTRPSPNANHDQYVRATGTCSEQLNSVMDHLRTILSPEAFGTVQRAVRLSSEETWTKFMADASDYQPRDEFARSNTRLHFRLKHVRTRLRERFKLDLSERQVTELARQWKDLPPVRINNVACMRRVMYNGHEIHAIYELHASGALELCTVLNPNDHTRPNLAETPCDDT